MLTNLTNEFRMFLMDELSADFDATVCDKENETTVLDLVLNGGVLSRHIDQCAGLENVTSRALKRPQ